MIAVNIFAGSHRKRPTQIAHKKEGCPHRNGTAPRQRFVSAAHTVLVKRPTINALTVIWFPQNVRAALPRSSVSTLAAVSFRDGRKRLA